MEYLKSLFSQNRFESRLCMMGKTYFPSSIQVDEFFDIDQVKTVTVKFITIHNGKESVITFGGSPCDVSEIIQELRED